jgi:hypothetical protein
MGTEPGSGFSGPLAAIPSPGQPHRRPDVPSSRAWQDVRLDITDLYDFRGETGTIFAINVCRSIFGEIPTPGYHPEGMNEFKIDLNGDAVEELTYRMTFDERDENGCARRGRGAACASGPTVR